MVDGINGTSAAADAFSTGSSPYAQAMNQAMGAVAQELGMTQPQLQSALQGGQTLEQIASAKGISSTQLQGTIQSALQSALPNASSTQVDNLAKRLEGGHHAHHAHGSGGASESSSGAGTGANMLEELEQSLETGESATTNSLYA